MFATESPSVESLGDRPLYTSLDAAEAELVRLERVIATARAGQIEMLGWLDRMKVHRIHGSRSMQEWTIAHLDVTPATARDLVAAARALSDPVALVAAPDAEDDPGTEVPGTDDPDTDDLEADDLDTDEGESVDAADSLSGGGSVFDDLAEGSVTFDRAVATTNLIAAGATVGQVDESGRWDLVGVRRRTAELVRMTRLDERRIMHRRHLTLEPTLGDTAWKLSGLLPAYEGHLISKALDDVADRLPAPPAGERESRAARRVDALATMALDSLDPPYPAPTRHHGDTLRSQHESQGNDAGDEWDDADEDEAGGIGDGGAESQVPTGRGGAAPITLFIDGRLADEADGELGARIAAGPRVGPDTIERILCGGAASIVGLVDGRPVSATNRSRHIPPAIRDAVLQRDGGCVIDGCRSRYRLEPHHIRHRADGGDHDLTNLATLCWYHHHIAVHAYGKRLDPDSPPHRRRFLYRPNAPPPLRSRRLPHGSPPSPGAVEIPRMAR